MTELEETRGLLRDACNLIKEVVALLQTEEKNHHSQVSHLMQENERIVRENEAYYMALKREREQNNQTMQMIVSQFCGRQQQPLVKIDQT